MWLLHLLPDSFLIYVINGICIAGAVATILGFFLGWVPFVDRWKLPLQLLGIALLVAGVYFKGGYSTEMEWRARVAEVEKKVAVAEITAATMRGEIINFSESLSRRVALLAGVPQSVLHSVYKERLQLNSGAEFFIAGAHERNMHTLLVSGGFTFFTTRMQERLHLSEAHSNELEIVDGMLTGRVLGEIVDGTAKNHYVISACTTLGLTKKNALVMGDGANDLLMMANAGLSVAYRAKQVVKEKADIALDFVGLDAVLQLL